MMYEKLLTDKKLLEKQLSWIEISYKECLSIRIKDEYDINEFGKFETLCSRYSRGINFLIKRNFRSLDDYELENQDILIDVVNNAHKRSLFDSVDEIRIMKDIRNTIAHEYVKDELKEIFDKVLGYSKNLIKIMLNTIKYINNIKDGN